MAAPGLLAGRLAVVTGGGSGIGRAVCQLFAKEGARVAVVDINQTGIEETLQSLEGQHQAFQTDVSSGKQVNDLVKNVKDYFSQAPCIAINAAGITKDALFLRMDEEKFDQVMNVNLKGTHLISQAVAREIVEGKIKGGSIINISSVSGTMGNVGQANYSASKAGVIGLTKTCAKELGRFGIRVNAIIPGFIETPMTDAVPDKVIEKMKKMIPLGRMGQPVEIAEACLYLASSKSSYMTGTTLNVSGGFSM